MFEHAIIGKQRSGQACLWHSPPLKHFTFLSTDESWTLRSSTSRLLGLQCVSKWFLSQEGFSTLPGTHGFFVWVFNLFLHDWSGFLQYIYLLLVWGWCLVEEWHSIDCRWDLAGRVLNCSHGLVDGFSSMWATPLCKMYSPPFLALLLILRISWRGIGICVFRIKSFLVAVWWGLDFALETQRGDTSYLSTYSSALRLPLGKPKWCFQYVSILS